MGKRESFFDDYENVNKKSKHKHGKLKPMKKEKYKKWNYDD